MITVVFSGNENVKNYITGLWQYDFGQVLRIQGLDLPTAVEIHFSLTETEGEAVTRIGTTKDGVTDVVIPDSMLENEDTEMDYNIYVFIYLTDETSGETVKRITLKVKARPRPEGFDTPDDAELFREAIKEVNNAADRAEEAERNASKYAAQTKQDAEQTAEDRREVERIVETVSDIGEHVDTVREYRDQAQTAATNALLSEQKAAETKETVIAAQAGAESAANAAEQHALDAAGDKAEVERLAAQVREDKDAVAQSKTSVENTVQNFGQTVQQAIQSVQSAGTGQISAVQSAGTQAVGQVNTAKGEAVKAVEDKGVEQVQALEDKGKEIIESFPTAPDLDAKLDKQQGIENAGKALVIGEDGNVVPGEVQTSIEVDATLTQQGKAADAKATGDKILQYAIKNTAQGESVVLQDSAEEKLLDMQMQGWTEQTKTEGKNLFELKKENLTNIKGKNVADIEGGIRFDYENLRDSWAEIDLNLKPNTTYTVYFGVKISNNNTTNYRIAWINKESDVDYFIEKSIAYSSEVQQNKYIRKTFTTHDTEEKIRFYLCGTRDSSGVSGYTEFTDFIIVEGEDSGLTYEPYTGGKPSPSPDYPQEIVNAGRKSKNLFDIDEFLTLTPVPVSGYGNARILTLTLKPNTPYTLSTDNEGTITGAADPNRSLYLTTKDDTNIIGTGTVVFKDNPKTKTTDENGKLKIALFERENALPIINREKYVMLNEGLVPLPYELYSDKHFVDICLKTENLFDETKLSGGTVVEFNSKKCYKYKDASGNFEYTDVFEEKVQYTIGFMIYREDQMQNYTTIFITYTDGTKQNIGNVFPGIYRTVKTNKDKTLKGLAGNNSYSKYVYIDLETIQIVKGDKLSQYQKTEKQLVTLTSDRPITKFDKLEKRDGVWGWVYKTGTFNLADAKNWSINDDGYTNNSTHRVYTEIPDAVRNSEAFCNKLYPFKAGDIVNIKTADYECFNISNGRYLQMKLLKERGTTVDELKAFFAESDIYVMYESVEEEFVPLSQEEQELLNNLYTYYPTTIISNSEDCEMQMIYAADTTTYVNNKIAEIAEVALKGV